MHSVAPSSLGGSSSRLRRRSHRAPIQLPALATAQRIQSRELEIAQPFSWSRCFVSLFSYALLLSDVIRSGFGVHSSSLSSFRFLEPDAIVHFGPYAYNLMRIAQAELTPDASPVPVWAYKYDTTSVSMRFVATQLRTPQWPPCVLYKGQCSGMQQSNTLTRRVVFDMIDATIESVGRTRHGRVVIRGEYEWFDRLHHFAFPWFFQRTVKRTTQALYFRLNSTSPSSLSLCGRHHTSTHRPFLCNDLWTKYQRLCDATSNAYCSQVVGSVWTHIEARMAALLAAYPSHTLEMALIEGSDDYTRQGIAFQGRKLFDVVTFTRLRVCSSPSDCTTVLVDDYRYEAACMSINAVNWFGIVAFIRGAGQAYAWIRLVFLFGGTYWALQDTEEHVNGSTWSLVVATFRTALVIPSQVVIYGSVLPIGCYVFAHLLDSAAVYELVALRFNSTLGNFNFNVKDFVRLCAVSMRSLWTLAMACHVMLALFTKRCWSPVHGLPGIPEFSISFVASLTILAQLRSTSWRSTKILQAHEVVPSQTRQRWQTMGYASPRTPLHKVLLGSTIDAQCLLSSLLFFLLLMLFSRCVGRLFPAIVRYRMSLFSRSIVPYSAGVLWLTNGLVVCWHANFFVRIPSAPERVTASWKTASYLVRAMPFRRLTRIKHFAWQVNRNTSTVALAITDTKISLQLQGDMHSITKRSREVESMVFLVNLAVMTDPLTFLRLRMFIGRLLDSYESTRTGERFLLPHALDVAQADIPVDFHELQLLTVVSSKDVAWWELLQCPNSVNPHLHFSWIRCVVSLISYALLLSDVLRTGLGLRGASSTYGLRTLEPDTLLIFEPASYPVQHLTRANATTSPSMKYWPYKYDTTSIAMRAFAEHLNVAAWPPCVLYQESCDESNGLAAHTVFAMIDSLVEAMSNLPSRQPGTRHTSSHAHLTLCTDNLYKDRLHHYAFPAFFTRTVKRTNQAIHHPYNGSTGGAHDSVPMCVTTNPTQPRPYSCEESWTNGRKTHADASYSAWEHIPKRLAMLAAQYPNHSVDAVILDGIEDFTRGGITYHRHKAMEVVVLTRIQQCNDSTSGSCTTVAVDDYRHETAALVMDVDSWYGVVATLRVVGQAYTWLRVLLLVAACTLARRQGRNRLGLLHETKATLRTLFLIPSQVVIYGSSFPIALYMLAHLIDSPTIYDLVFSRFVTVIGNFHWNTSDFIRYCAVSMRTAWILGLLCHILLFASTKCVWSPTHGIPGVSEMLISLVASVTIFAQYRSLSFRDTRLLQIHETIPSQRMHQRRSITHDGTRTVLNNLFFGSTVDAQCFG